MLSPRQRRAANAPGRQSLAGNQVACGLVFLKCQVHKAVAFGGALHKQACVFMHRHEEFPDLLGDFGVGVVSIPVFFVEVCPCFTQHLLDFALSSQTSWFVDVQSVGQGTQQGRHIIFFEQGRFLAQGAR